MNDRFSLAIFTIEVDGRPTIAFEAKRYAEAEANCGDGLRAKLSLQKSGDVPVAATARFWMCGSPTPMKRPFIDKKDRQAAGASRSTDDLMLTYLVELDGPGTG
jgi:hypothetical protein